MGRTTGNIILSVANPSIKIKPIPGQPGRYKTSLKTGPIPPAKWPKKCLDLIADPANKLVVLNTIGDDTKLVKVPRGQQTVWIDRFNKIKGVTASAEQMLQALTS